MLIGLDASRANRKFKGGTEWYSYYLIRELAKIDSTNQYILYSDKPLTSGLSDLTNEDAEAGDKIVKENGFQIIKSPHHNFKAKILNWPFAYLWTQIRFSLEMLIYPPDVLFIPAHALPYFHAKKSVVTIHDVGFERKKELYSLENLGPNDGLSGKFFHFFVQLFSRGQIQSNILDYHRWSTKFSLKHAKKIIAVSEFTRKELMDIYKAPAAKIAMIYNGFNSSLYRPIGDRAKIKRVLSEYDLKEPYIFYVGRLEKKKNVARLVNAFAVMKQKHKEFKHKLVLAGKAGLGFDEIKYVIDEFDLDNEVMITGWVPEADMPYFYAGASLFVFPSLYEGFGIPLVEAMACGAPVVASRVASIPEITAGAALLFNPKIESDIAEKMIQVLSDKKLASDLIERGYNRANFFSLAKCAEETLSTIYQMN